MHPLPLLLPLLLSLLHAPAPSLAHGHQVPISHDADWATRHMAEEHHIANMDPSAFFTLHDYDSSGFWTQDEIRRTYGLDDEAVQGGVDEGRKKDIVQIVVDIFDGDGDGVVSREEWMVGWVGGGKRLPDFGVGLSNQGGRGMFFFGGGHDANV